MRTWWVRLTVVAMMLFGGACAAPTPSNTPAPSAPSGQSAASAPAHPKRLVTAMRGDPKTLNGAISAAAGGSSTAGVPELTSMLSAGLLNLDAQGNLHPMLAEQVPTLENGLWKLLPDGRMETTWRLKPNLQWHDGKPITAEDLVFTAAVGRDRAIPMQQPRAFQFVDTVEAPDARTLHVTWKSTFIEADRLLSLLDGSAVPPLPKHLLEQTFLEDKANFASSPYLGMEYVGSGAYKLQSWVIGSHLVIEANDQFVLGRPKIDTIEVRFILDTNTLVANVLSGEVHATIGRGLTPEQAITVREVWKDGKVDAGLQNTTSLFPQLFNPEPALLTDVRFRRALLHGLNRQQLVDAFLGGLMPVAHSIITPDEPDYPAIESYLVKYEFDPRRSMQLLDSMGLARGADGFYVDPNTGRRLSVEVRTRSHVLREKLQQVIADEWGRIGVEGKPDVTPEQRVNDRAYQANFPGFYFRFGAPSQIVNWKSELSPVAENNYVGSNTMRYRSPEYDALVDRYLVTIPRAERAAVLGQMVQHSTEQLTPLPLYHEPEPMLVSNRLVNASGPRGNAIHTWNVHEWDLR